MSFVGGSDPLKPIDRLEKPVNKFDWDLNALRAVVLNLEDRINHLELQIPHKNVNLVERDNTLSLEPKKREKKAK